MMLKAELLPEKGFKEAAAGPGVLLKKRAAVVAADDHDID